MAARPWGVNWVGTAAPAPLRPEAESRWRDDRKSSTWLPGVRMEKRAADVGGAEARDTFGVFWLAAVSLFLGGCDELRRGVDFEGLRWRFGDDILDRDARGRSGSCCPAEP